MKIFSRFIKIMIILVFILVVFVSTVTAQQKYALLISTGQTTVDDNDYHSEYWYDLFLMYRMLIEDGFTHDNIYVLYGNGTDFNSAHANYQRATFFPALPQVTDYAVNKTNVANIFTWIANGNAAEGIPQIQDGDFLYYWWMGHGAWDTYPVLPITTEYYASISTTGEQVRDDEFANYFGQLPDCLVRTLYVMTCHSGGMIEEVEGLHTMIHTAAQWDESAYSALYDVWHAELSYHAANAFREQDPAGTPVASDVDGDGLVSAEETNNYAHSHVVLSNSQVGDYRNTAPLIFIANAQPAGGVPVQGVYSRDYEEDNGIEPSDYMSYIWYHGPDLWVRNALDGQTVHQDPEFGQTNYVYARIHNIGCSLLGNVDVEFSWCLQSAWSNPASWNAIDTVSVANLNSSETRVIYTPWTTVPSPGVYCLHTVLDTTGDLHNADGRAYMDNNKVQINVNVVDNFWGWVKPIPFLIENGTKELSRVDLVIEKLRIMGLFEQPGLSLEIPRDLKFERLIGGRKKEQGDGQVIIEIDPKIRRAVLQGVVLGPNEKKNACLSVTTPKGIKLGESVVVKITEQIRGKEMGGIIINVRTASRKKVLSTLFRKLGNLFKMMDEKFKVTNAAEISKLCSEFKKNCKITDPRILKKAMTVVTRLETGAAKDMSKLMKKGEFYKFRDALRTSREAVEKNDAGLFVESQDRMIFSTVPMFLRKMER